VYYCSEACQQRDWKVHKKTCGPKYDGTLDALDQMTLDDTEVPSSQLGSFGDFESKVLISISSGADVNAVLAGNNSTLLHLASVKGSEDLVRALIAAGADDRRAGDAHALGRHIWS
jgi:ankyrin repeat protein